MKILCELDSCCYSNKKVFRSHINISIFKQKKLLSNKKSILDIHVVLSLKKIPELTGQTTKMKKQPLFWVLSVTTGIFAD